MRTRQKTPTRRSFRGLRNFLILSVLTSSIVALVFSISYFTQKSSNFFPTLEVQLTDVPIEEINYQKIALGSESARYDSTITLNTDTESLIFENVTIRGRGNSTWNFPKKPYQIKLQSKFSLLDLNPAKKWILLADYIDETHLRNDTAFYLQHLLESNFPLNGHHLELYIDNTYYGLYYLTEKVEVHKNRIDLKDPFGIIIELDNLHNDSTCPRYSASGDCYAIQDAVNQDVANISFAAIIEKINSLEDAINNQNYPLIEQLIDVDSFARYFLINEFSNNPDAYGSSFFLYSDGEDDKIHASAGWDFDAAFGNKHLEIPGIDHDLLISPNISMILKDYLSADNAPKTTSSTEHLDRISPLIYNLMDIPDFKARVKQIYQSTLSGKVDDLAEHVRTQANYIKDAANRDIDRWKLDANFDDEVDYLIDWIIKRCDHFERLYGAI